MSEITETVPEITEKAPEITEKASEITEKTPEITEKAPEITETVAIGIENEAPTGLFRVDTPEFSRASMSFNLLVEAKDYYDKFLSQKSLYKIVKDEEILLLKD